MISKETQPELNRIALLENCIQTIANESLMLSQPSYSLFSGKGHYLFTYYCLYQYSKDDIYINYIKRDCLNLLTLESV